MKRLKSVTLKGTCPRCGEEVEIQVTKRQIKAIWKGMKAASPAQAEKTVEKILGRDNVGDFNP